MEQSEAGEVHIYNLSLIPAGAVLAIFLVLLAYLLHNGMLKAASDFFWFAIPCWVAIIETIFISFEVFYKRKTGKPFNLKRLAGRTIILIIGFASFIAILRIAYIFQFLLKSEDITIIAGAAAWFLVWFLVIIGFKRKFKKLSDGTWLLAA